MESFYVICTNCFLIVLCTTDFSSFHICLSSDTKQRSILMRKADFDIIMVARSFIIFKKRLLAIRRTAIARNNPSLWEVPGGQRKDEQSIRSTLKREVKEETGLSVQPIELTTSHQYKTMLGGKYDGALQIVCFGISLVEESTVVLSHEHDDSRWCRYDDFMRLNLTKQTRQAALASRLRLQSLGVL